MCVKKIKADKLAKISASILKLPIRDRRGTLISESPFSDFVLAVAHVALYNINIERKTDHLNQSTFHECSLGRILNS